MFGWDGQDWLSAISWRSVVELGLIKRRGHGMSLFAIHILLKNGRALIRLQIREAGKALENESVV
jgi:hypothetical protein